VILSAATPPLALRASWRAVSFSPSSTWWP
jgi:hypothetical protein